MVGYLIAAWEYPRAAAWYAHYVNSQWTADIAGFFTIFFVVLLLAGLAGRLVRWAVKGIGLRWFDRFLGAVFGCIRRRRCKRTVIVLAPGGIRATVGMVAAVCASRRCHAGRQSRVDLGGAAGVTAALLVGMGAAAHRAATHAAGTSQRRQQSLENIRTDLCEREAS